MRKKTIWILYIIVIILWIISKPLMKSYGLQFPELYIWCVAIVTGLALAFSNDKKNDE